MAASLTSHCMWDFVVVEGMALLPILVFWHAAKTSRAAHVSAEVAHVFSVPLAVPSVSLSARKFDGTTNMRCGSGKLHVITSRGIKMLPARKAIWLPVRPSGCQAVPV